MARAAPARIAVVLLATALTAPLALSQATSAPVAAPTATASSALPRTLPLRRDEPAPAMGTGLAAAVLLLALVAAAGFYVLRGTTTPAARGWRWRSARSDHAVARVSSLPLTPQASLHAVRWNGEELLLACTAQQVTVVARKALPPVAGDGA